MHLPAHIVFGIILLIGLLPWFPLAISLIIVFASVLIDVDHYLWYIVFSNDYSPRKAYKWFLEHEQPTRLFCVFHSPEFVFCVVFGAFFFGSVVLFAVLAGMIFHLCCDYAYDDLIVSNYYGG